MPPTLAQYLSDALASVFLTSGSDFLPIINNPYSRLLQLQIQNVNPYPLDIQIILTVESINSMISLITPIVTAGIAITGTRWVVNNWQTRKDKSEIRKEVLKNFILFKNHVVMMDNFVAKLIITYAKFDNSSTAGRYRLSELLPWGYSYEDLEYYSNEIKHDNNMTDFKNNAITNEQIKERFKILKELTEYYIDFQDPPLKKFDSQFAELQKNFYNYSSVMEFKALAGLYYNNSKLLLDNFSGMWEYMVACYILFNSSRFCILNAVLCCRITI
jgi:hypothetical protein